MGKDLYDAHAEFKDTMDQCDAILTAQGDLDEPLLSVIFSGKASLNDKYAQAAVFSLQVSLYALFDSWGVVASVVIGKGLGELAAAHIAGAMSLEDALKLAATRDTNKFREAVKAATFKEVSMNMVSSMTGKKVTEKLDAAYWMEQAGARGRFEDAITTAHALKCDAFLEVGPGSSLLGKADQALDKSNILFVASMSSLSGDVMAAISTLHCNGATIKWDEVYSATYRRTRLPLYPWQKKRFWVDMVKGDPITGKVQLALEQPSPVQAYMHDLSWDQKDQLTGEADASAAGSYVAVVKRSGKSEAFLAQLTAAGLNASATNVNGLASALARGSTKAVLFLLGMDATTDTDNDDVVALCDELLAATKAVVAAKAPMYVVTLNSQQVGILTVPVNLSQAPLLGFTKSFALEHPELYGGIIDVDHSVQAKLVIKELLASDGEDIVVLRKGGERLGIQLPCALRRRERVPGLHGALPRHGRQARACHPVGHVGRLDHGQGAGRAEGPADGYKAVVLAAVVHVCAEHLGFAESGMDESELDVTTGLTDLGMDSMIAIEIRQGLSDLTGVDIPSTTLFDYPNVTAAVDYIVKDVLKIEGGAAGVLALRNKRKPKKAAAVAAPAAALLPVVDMYAMEAPVVEAPEDSDDLAIVGLACRFPGGADSPAAFWQLLCEGFDGTCDTPAGRWSPALYNKDRDAPGSICIKRGGFLQNVDLFDAEFFNLSNREAITPQQRLVLESSWAALEDAGVNPSTLVGSNTGVFVGVSHSDYCAIQAGCDPMDVDSYLSTGTSTNVIAGRLSYFLGLQGPAMCIDTACSSSLVALHVGAESVRKVTSLMRLRTTTPTPSPRP